MKLKTTLFCALMLSFGANAELIETDWKAGGDALATLHEETGLEWLDLTQTDGMSIDQVAAQTGEGGSFEGWRIATFDEIDTFVRYAFGEKLPEGSTQAQGGNTNEPVYRSFYELMGLTHTIDQRRHSLGVGADDAGNVYTFGVLGYTSGGTSTYFRSGYAESSSTTSTAKPERGVFLVSDGGTTLSSINNPSLNANNPAAPINANAVPVIGIGAMSLFGLLGRRKRTA
ncbi:MAG: hypothetical protein GY774_11065 [Planctomycetes bacterium]|nr:hypothetical protein [Planctomycetota bacterium]